MARTKHLVWETGRIAGTAVTGTYQSLVEATQDAVLLFIFNTTDNPIYVSLDGGVTDTFELVQESVTIDLRANDYLLPKPSVSVKHLGVAPTTGSVRVNIGLA